ncbi:pilus assembly protein TadG-related protein [Brevibacterium senegalense]|uniref:pilus assembly protein TadG-related protein n=1 Tax=Brevibacterium senegalense TaxID=1033736 RepID=UPI0003171F2C|nr:pilus assembly protein TadG-related protein [Brevibacterium senegalense]
MTREGGSAAQRTARLLRSLCRAERSDEGSITPLTIGFASIALALILLAALITDVWLAHRKLFALADSAALAAAESFDPAPTEEPGILLTDDGVSTSARAYLNAVDVSPRYSDVRLVGSSPDGLSAHVDLRATYTPVLLSPFSATWIELEASATVRGALRL